MTKPTKQFLKEAMDFLMPIIKQAREMALERWNKIEISKQKDSRDITTKADREWMLEKLNKIMEKSYRTRMSGGAFSVYLVTGAIDAYITIEGKGFKPQDAAPRLIIMQEAGYEAKRIETAFNKKVLVVSREPLLSELENILSN